jgi:hypothetical protein
VKVHAAIRQTVATHAAVVVSGAMTPIQFEGLDADGHLSVLVGMVWSDRQQRLAEAMWNPELPSRPGTPGLSIAARIAEETQRDPAWLASTNGVRKWEDEKGEKVLLAFGAAPATSLPSMDRSRASDRALAALQRFVGERIAGSSNDRDNLIFQERGSGQENTFDSGQYFQKIVANSREITIRGTSPVHEWRGQHPIGRANMQVVVLAWSPSRDAAAAAIGSALKEGEERMRRQGAAPAPGSPARENSEARPAPVGVPTRAGARTDRGDY